MAGLPELQKEVGQYIRGLPVPLPRLILGIVLSRDPFTDLETPAQAIAETESTAGPFLAHLYAQFLSGLSRNLPSLRIAETLENLITTPTEDLPAFLVAHPEAHGPAAIADVARCRDAATGDQEAFSMLAALHHLLLDLANGVDAAKASSRYRDTFLTLIEQGPRHKVNQLLDLANSSPDGQERIAALQRILAIIGSHWGGDLERWVTATLAAELLTAVGPDEAPRLEEAIRLLQRSRDLTVTQDSLWVVVTQNLASAYGQRLSGDLLDNWHSSVDLLREACSADNADDRSKGISHTNLGLALVSRPGGGTAEEITEALEQVDEGLRYRSPERDPRDWCYSQVNLGHIYQLRKADGDLLRALEHYREALRHVSPDAHPSLWIAAQMNLAMALASVEHPDFQAATIAADAALAFARTVGDPRTLGRALELVATIATRVADDITAPEALLARQEAVRLLSPRLWPQEHLASARVLADAYQRLGRAQEAANVFEGALDALDALWNAQTRPEARNQVLRENSRLARWAAFALAAAGRTERAAAVIEQGLARELALMTNRETVDLQRLGMVDAYLAERYRSAVRNYAAAISQSGRISATPGCTAFQADDDLQKVIAEVRAIPGFELFLLTPNIEELFTAQRIPRIVYAISAPEGSCLLTLYKVNEQVHLSCHRIGSITSFDIFSLIFVNAEDGAPGIVAAQMHNSPEPFRMAVTVAEERLRPLLQFIADDMRLGDEGPTVLIPTGLLGLLPLQSFVLDENGTTLDDLGPIHLSPSLMIYAASRRKAERAVTIRLLGIADTESTFNPLGGSRAELDSIARHFTGPEGSETAKGADGTVAWFLERASEASHIHLACHGSNDLADPFGARIRMAGGQALSGRDLIGRGIPNCRLAVASACQSGHFALGEVPDEFIGLAGGLLQAGAACSVVSLWPVEDASTALLMTYFYEQLQPSQPAQSQCPQTALRKAKLWLRGLTMDERDAYLRDRPSLETDLRRVGLLPPTRSIGKRYPYADVRHWGAFVAYGC